MKHLAAILLFALCATASAQTIKTLGYNTTNGQVVYTNTNALHITNDYIKLDSDLAISNNALLFAGGIVYEPETGTFYNSINIGTGGTNSLSISLSSSGIAIDGGKTNQVFELLSTNLAPAIRADLGLGGGITATNVFVDLSTNTNTVTISNGIITSWTVTP